MGHYPRHRAESVQANPSFPSLEEETLAYWAENNTFKKSVENRPAGKNGANEFVFYDGPPFANGLPHYGHLLTGYVKDIVARYQTQLGRRVERRFGWDTHGLPAELEAQRVLGISDKEEIEKIGIAKFNETCRTSVLKYTEEWRKTVTRTARWVDFDNDYKTMDPSYVESVIWAFKKLYDEGLAYEGHRVLPYCWNDQTPLSNHELKMDDDVYQERQDNTVTVGLRLETGELALIWTTTPWTLPSNLAIAVGPEIDYQVIKVAAELDSPLAGETVILAADLAGNYAKELGEEPEVVKTIKGSELVGRRYAPIFDYFIGREADQAPGPNAWTIIGAEFVTTTDGTGLVHIAPAFGEDDMFACMEAGIQAVVPVDEGGCFTAEVHDYTGRQVFECNKQIITDLRDGSGPMARRPEEVRAVLVRQQSFAHSYPHCWRCRKPLIYRAVSSWFVKVSAIKDRLVELNQDIKWVPEHIKDGQFGNWLAGARDWSISRNRYWGSPIPVWKSDDPNYPRVDVYGSIAELEADFGVKVEDLHRPFIDSLVRPNPDDPTGKSMMRRIPDVLDCWFDSGSMPYAQVHYPFENGDWFEHHYPGDFIVEYIGQTRGWFYTLHVLATALFDRPAFRNCVCHGIVLGNDGRKMSKSLRNYPDVNEVLDSYGSDAMRWFLMSSPVVRGGNLIVTEEGIRETVRQVILPLWNIYYFFALYAGTCNNGAGYLAKPVNLEDQAELDKLAPLDRYLLARTAQLVENVKARMDAFDIPGACELFNDHLDLLTNWYVRTSRQRFWDEEEQAYDTLYTALELTLRVMAPLAPLVCEEIWRGLTGEESVHLTDYPVLPEHVYDAELVSTMDLVRQVVSGAHSLRKTNSLRVRQPLPSLTVVRNNFAQVGDFKQLIADEVNVKEVILKGVEESGLQVVHQLKPLPKEFAPELRRYTSSLFAAAKQGAWEQQGDQVVFPQVEHEGKALVLEAGQYELSTSVIAESGEIATVLGDGTFVVLDTEITPELEAEGYARDVIRAIQEQRKQDDLHVSDRIKLVVSVPEARVAQLEAFKELVAGEVLAAELKVEAGQSETVVVKITEVVS